jgi:pyruvate dehydrogenase E2 component (dihydrolipoamide acetyltransferase)/2-oxoisovalerate dehydrogenase E2 component (dihydrolipoyl transacylase)
MQFVLPEIGEGIYEAELIRWVVQPGSAVKPGQTLLEVMTDKATMEVPSPFAGTITAIHGEAGQKVKIGEVILEYTPAGEKEKENAAPASAPTAAPAAPTARAENRAPVAAPTSTPSTTPASVRAAPSVRQLARKLGIDLTQVRGSGPGGRILLEDVTARLVPPSTPTPAKAARREPSLDVGKAGSRVKLVGLRRKIAEHMVHAKHTIPHYSYVDECDVTPLVALRDALKDTYASAGIKLTYLAFVVKAVALALREVPVVNASLDDAAGEVVYHANYHVGVAVATPGGLIVPVVRDADRKDIGTIARDIERLSEEARNGKSRLDDLRGGTFTVTSIGSIGGLISTPVVNHPEVGILGIGKIVRRPIYDEQDRIVPGSMLYLSFSFDHRVVDGAVGALFGNAIVRRLRNPATLLLPEKL